MSKSVSFTDAYILPVSQLLVKGTGLVLLTSPHVFYFQYDIPQGACGHTTQVIHWGFCGVGAGIHKGQAFVP